uniref:Sulfotransfer_1 domain-containing protein n=1 Tax=Steinernema glaseri TaxID=37863 RepID=A0A1I7Y9M8_9BILA
MILTQPLKHPTMVLARDPVDFELNHRAEVEDFLGRYGFLKPMPLFNVNSALHFANASACLDADLFYSEL